MKTEMTMPQLLFQVFNKPILNGSLKGICAFCGVQGTNFFKFQAPDTFTAAEYLHGFEMICPACNQLYQNPTYRNNNWLLTAKTFEILDRGHILSKLCMLSPEEMPFCLYTTDTYKKQGYLRLIRSGLNYNLEFITIAWDAFLLMTSLKQIKQYVHIGLWAKNQGVYQSELLSGNIRIPILREIERKFHNTYQFQKLLNLLFRSITFQWVITFLPKDSTELITQLQLNVEETPFE